LGVDFTDDKEKAIAIRKAFWAGTFVPALFTEKIYTPKMSETNGKAVGSDTISEPLCISADADVHVKFARHYIDLGFNHLIFHAAGPDQHAMATAGMSFLGCDKVEFAFAGWRYGR
jgi:coenzyme F420-dependent glucose-6-phosphate dehydrogenase